MNQFVENHWLCYFPSAQTQPVVYMQNTRDAKLLDLFTFHQNHWSSSSFSPRETAYYILNSTGRDAPPKYISKSCVFDDIIYKISIDRSAGAKYTPIKMNRVNNIKQGQRMKEDRSEQAFSSLADTHTHTRTNTSNIITWPAITLP